MAIPFDAYDEFMGELLRKYSDTVKERGKGEEVKFLVIIDNARTNVSFALNLFDYFLRGGECRDRAGDPILIAIDTPVGTSEMGDKNGNNKPLVIHTQSSCRDLKVSSAALCSASFLLLPVPIP